MVVSEAVPSEQVGMVSKSIVHHPSIVDALATVQFTERIAGTGNPMRAVLSIEVIGDRHAHHDRENFEVRIEL